MDTKSISQIPVSQTFLQEVKPRESITDLKSDSSSVSTFAQEVVDRIRYGESMTSAVPDSIADEQAEKFKLYFEETLNKNGNNVYDALDKATVQLEKDFGAKSEENSVVQENSAVQENFANKVFVESLMNSKADALNAETEPKKLTAQQERERAHGIKQYQKMADLY